VPGNQLQMDLTQLQGVSGQFATDVGDLEQTLFTLISEGDTYTATWKGDAHTAYLVAHDNLISAWKQLNGVLDEISSGISTASATTGNTDSQGASNIGKVPTTDITAMLSR
jgi:WXG100 family type VII secretion target